MKGFFLCLMSSPRGLGDRDRCRALLKKGGEMTGAISLLFRAPALQDEGSVCMCERECQEGTQKKKQRKRERQCAALTQKKTTDRHREPVGSLINQGCTRQETPGGAHQGRQVSMTQ